VNYTIYTGTGTEGDRFSDEVRCGGGYEVLYLSGRDHASHNLEAKDTCEEIHNYQHCPKGRAGKSKRPRGSILPTSP
jgi:hypothetical protein